MILKLLNDLLNDTITAKSVSNSSFGNCCLNSYSIICQCLFHYLSNSDSERTHTSFYKVFKNGSKVSYKLNNEIKLSNCSSIIQLVGQNIILKKRKKARTKSDTK